MNFRMALATILVLGSSYPLAADQIRYDSAARLAAMGRSALGRGGVDPIGLDPANPD